MGIFRRKRKPVELPVHGHDDLVAVRDSEVDPLLDEITAAVLDHMRSATFDEETLRILQVGLPFMTERHCSDDAILAGQTAARLGFLTRAVEFDRLHAAREADLELAGEFEKALARGEGRAASSVDVLTEFAVAMVRSEPVNPTPDEGGPSWMLPGLGADLRGQLRDAQLTRVPNRDGSVSTLELQEVGKFGYFLRALTEFFRPDAEQH